VLEHPPTAAVARFLGYDGELRAAGPDRCALLLTRPSHVKLDPDGPLTARVVRVIPGEDGARLELSLDHGRLFTFAPYPAPRAGDEVRVRIDGGARF
jgi:hypothetical protein